MKLAVLSPLQLCESLRVKGYKDVSEEEWLAMRAWVRECTNNAAKPELFAEPRKSKVGGKNSVSIVSAGFYTV